MYDLTCIDELVRVDGDRLVTDSLIVAQTFGKRHKNVLQAHDKLPCSPERKRLPSAVSTA